MVSWYLFLYNCLPTELKGVYCDWGNQVRTGGEVYFYLEQTSWSLKVINNMRTYLSYMGHPVCGARGGGGGGLAREYRSLNQTKKAEWKKFLTFGINDQQIFCVCCLCLWSIVNNLSLGDSSPLCSMYTRSKDSQVKTQIVIWIFILFKVTRWQHVSASITRPSSGHK
jgi:hypothetical protein